MDVFNKAKCNKPFCNMEHKVVAASHIILMDSFSLPVDCDRFTNYRLVNASSVYYHHSIGVFKYSYIALNWKWTAKNRAILLPRAAGSCFEAKDFFFFFWFWLWRYLIQFIRFVMHMYRPDESNFYGGDITITI